MLNFQQKHTSCSPCEIANTMCAPPQFPPPARPNSLPRTALYEAVEHEFASQREFVAHLTSSNVDRSRQTVFDLKRLARQKVMDAKVKNLCYNIESYNVKWDPNDHKVAQLAAMIWTRFRIVALPGFFSPEELDLIKRTYEAVSKTTGEFISGQRCLQWKLADYARWETGLKKLKDGALRDAYLHLWGVEAPRRLQLFFAYTFGTTDGGADDMLRFAEAAFLAYIKEGDQRTHLDHLRPRTFNAMVSANGEPIYPTAMIDLQRAVAATTPPEKRDLALRELLRSLQKETMKPGYLHGVFEPHASEMFGPFAPTLATGILSPSTLLLFDPHVAHFGVGDRPNPNADRVVHFAAFTTDARMEYHTGEYANAPEEFLLFPWHDRLRQATLNKKRKKGRGGKTKQPSFIERMHDQALNPTPDEFLRQRAFLDIAVIFTFHSFRKIEGDKDATAQSKLELKRHEKVRSQAKQRFSNDVRADSIIDAYRHLESKQDNFTNIIEDESSSEERRPRKKARAQLINKV